MHLTNILVTHIDVVVNDGIREKNLHVEKGILWSDIKSQICANLNIFEGNAELGWRLGIQNSNEGINALPRALSDRHEWELAVKAVVEGNANARSRTKTLCVINLVSCIDILKCLSTNVFISQQRKRQEETEATSNKKSKGKKRGREEDIPPSVNEEMGTSHTDLITQASRELGRRYKCEKHAPALCVPTKNGCDSFGQEFQGYWAKEIVRIYAPG